MIIHFQNISADFLESARCTMVLKLVKGEKRKLPVHSFFFKHLPTHANQYLEFLLKYYNFYFPVVGGSISNISL